VVTITVVLFDYNKVVGWEHGVHGAPLVFFF
jgi:hypothetical protein